MTRMNTQQMNAIAMISYRFPNEWCNKMKVIRINYDKCGGFTTLRFMSETVYNLTKDWAKQNIMAKVLNSTSMFEVCLSQSAK